MKQIEYILSSNGVITVVPGEASFREIQHGLNIYIGFGLRCIARPIG